MKLAAILCILLVYKGSANPDVPKPLNPELDLLLPAEPSPDCPLGYSQPLNSNWDKCYKVYDDYRSRQNASAECKLNNGVLASVHDDSVNSYLYSLASRADATSLWLGVQCSKEMETCINDDGTPFDYDNFYAGQPTDNDICVYMSTIGRDKQKWSTFHCQQYFQFACEVSKNAGNPVSTSTTRPTKTTRNPLLKCPPNYNEFQGTCYRIISNYFNSHDDVVRECRKVPGGDIVSIPTRKVNDFLVSMPTDCPALYYVIIGLQCPNVAFDGDTSSCAWDDGTRFSYNNFATGYPIITNNNNGCAYMKSGVWRNHFSCDEGLSCGACEAPMSAVSTTTPSTSTKTTKTSTTLTTPTARTTKTTTRSHTTTTRNSDPRLRCPQNYHEFQGTCYRIIQSPYITHYGLVQQCRQIPGGDIVSIPSQEVNDFLNSMPSDCPSAYGVIIGLRCSNVMYSGDTSSCYWEDGTSFSYNNFRTGQPVVTNMNNECAYMLKGEWYTAESCNTYWSCGACEAPLDYWPILNSSTGTRATTTKAPTSTARDPWNNRYNSDSKTYYNFAAMLLLTYFL